MLRPWCKWTVASGGDSWATTTKREPLFKRWHTHNAWPARHLHNAAFYFSAVNTVSFTSFQWRHNGFRQKRGERQRCERKKYCSSSLQLPCTLSVTGLYCRFGRRKQCSVGEWLSTLQTERVSQGQATKRSVRQRGPRTPPQRSTAAVTPELSPSNNSFAALNNFRHIWISTFSKGLLRAPGRVCEQSKKNQNELSGVRNRSPMWSEKFKGVRKSPGWNQNKLNQFCTLLRLYCCWILHFFLSHSDSILPGNLKKTLIYVLCSDCWCNFYVDSQTDLRWKLCKSPPKKITLWKSHAVF